jgi:hypothetical protein
MSRFDYIRYDDFAMKKQEIFKSLFEKIEAAANDLLNDSRAKSLLMTALEESYMWSGKAIRDDQITRLSGGKHEPTRTKS